MLRLRLQRWLLKRIDRSLAKRREQSKEVILYLARLLLEELRASGYDTQGTNVEHVDLWVFSDNELRVANVIKGWEVKGPMHEPTGHNAPQ